MNLDTQPMKQAIKPSHFHIPTPQELRHDFRGSYRFSVVDLNHAFHQFPMAEESANLFVFEFGPETIRILELKDYKYDHTDAEDSAYEDPNSESLNSRSKSVTLKKVS